MKGFQPYCFKTWGVIRVKEKTKTKQQPQPPTTCSEKGGYLPRKEGFSGTWTYSQYTSVSQPEGTTPLHSCYNRGQTLQCPSLTGSGGNSMASTGRSSPSVPRISHGGSRTCALNGSLGTYWLIHSGLRKKPGALSQDTKYCQTQKLIQK